MEKAEAEIMEAFRGGVNYFDTAYIYPGSEAAVGAIFEKNGIRDQINIATKLPHYLLKKHDDLDRYFNEQLKRLRTDHIDYYLMHMLTDTLTWNRLEELGIKEWLTEKKACGQIRQIGFSYHGNSDTFCDLLECYDWEFCQIQYNYLDETSQAGITGLKKAAGMGLPVIIMEPLRGGRLVNNLPREAKEAIERYPKQKTPAGWAFDWLWDQSEVTCVLSGMNSTEMVRENVENASAAKPGMLTAEDRALIETVKKEINAKIRVPCTGCRYCMPCPQGVDIPGTFSSYNKIYSDNWFTGEKEYFMTTTLRTVSAAASKCVKCGKCEQHCPQHISIRSSLEEARKKLEGPVYRIGAWGIRLFRKY